MGLFHRGKLYWPLSRHRMYQRPQGRMQRLLRMQRRRQLDLRSLPEEPQQLRLCRHLQNQLRQIQLDLQNRIHQPVPEELKDLVEVLLLWHDQCPWKQLLLGYPNQKVVPKMTDLDVKPQPRHPLSRQTRQRPPPASQWLQLLHWCSRPRGSPP